MTYLETSINHKKMAENIPVLFTTYNRLNYTKQTLFALIKSTTGQIVVFDNGSTDGTKEWLEKINNKKVKIHFNAENQGISGAMNYFFKKTADCKYVAKVDNDTMVNKDWLEKLVSVADKLSLDLVQAKHPILKISHSSGDFDEWMQEKKQDRKIKTVYYSNHIGGSGVLIRRSIVKEKLNSKWILGGWDKFQENHPELKKAFCVDTEVKILDTKEGKLKDQDYPDYYKHTGRKDTITIKEQNDWILHLEKDIETLNNEIKILKNKWSFRLIEKIEYSIKAIINRLRG